MWSRYYSMMLLVLLLAVNKKALATDWERVLQQGKLNSSSLSIAGTVVQSDTLRLARKYNPTPVSAHFVNAHITDSLFNDYASRTRKQDALEWELRMREFNIMVAKQNAKARKLNQPPAAFEQPIKEERLFIYDMLDVKRFRIKVTEVLKAGGEVKRGDTITVIVLPVCRFDTTTSIRKGKVVVYYKPYDNKEEVVQKEYFTAEMLEFYRRNRIYITAADRIEPEQWKAILVQY